MFDKWVSIDKNLGKSISEGGVIQRDEELPNLARVAIELKRSKSPPGDHYEITVGVYGALVHTAFFRQWEDAVECADAMKLIIQALLNTMNSWEVKIKS